MKKFKPQQSIILLVLQRTLAFTFFFGIAFVGALIIFIKWIINFIRFGGESIAYTDKMNRKIILDVFNKLNEKQVIMDDRDFKDKDSLQGCSIALCVGYWVAFDWMKIETRPKKYGKYLICRKDGKIHWETWNGNGWAYNHNEIRFWAEINPPYKKMDGIKIETK